METRRRRDRRAHLPAVHVRARHRPDRLHLQPVPDRRRRADPLPHRPPAHVPGGVGGHRHGDAARPPALDHVRPPRSRRVRRHEPLPRGGPGRPGGPHRHRLHGVDRRPGRPPAGPAGRRDGRPRWSAHPEHRHPPRAPRVGRPRPLRGDHRHPVLRRPPHPGRGRAGVTADDIVGAAIEAEDMFGSVVPHPPDGTHHPPPGRARPVDARHHARLVVRRRARPRPSWPSPTSTSAGWSPPTDGPRTRPSACGAGFVGRHCRPAATDPGPAARRRWPRPPRSRRGRSRAGSARPSRGSACRGRTTTGPGPPTGHR